MVHIYSNAEWKKKYFICKGNKKSGYKLSGRGERYYKKKLWQNLHGQKGHRVWSSGKEKQSLKKQIDFTGSNKMPTVDKSPPSQYFYTVGNPNTDMNPSWMKIIVRTFMEAAKKKLFF